MTTRKAKVDAPKKTTKRKTKTEVVTPEVLTKTYPFVTIGSHLAVIEYENGQTELIWDDEQLLKEVQEAIASVK